jgi:hypothetical protein
MLLFLFTLRYRDLVSMFLGLVITNSIIIVLQLLRPFGFPYLKSILAELLPVLIVQMSIVLALISLLRFSFTLFFLLIVFLLLTLGRVCGFSTCLIGHLLKNKSHLDEGGKVGVSCMPSRGQSQVRLIGDVMLNELLQDLNFFILESPLEEVKHENGLL